VDFTAWLSFTLISLVILITPGITVAYIISQSLTHGKKAAIPLSSGVVLGDLACFIASVLGVGALLVAYPSLNTMIKFAGAAYLIYLGVSSLLAKGDNSMIEAAGIQYSAVTLFKNTFFITFLNPKGILFFGAFFPQFIDQQQSLVLQTGILGSTFVALAMCTSLSFSLACAAIQSWPAMAKFKANFHYVSGFMLVLLGIFTIL
jgi:threonine/homoserine/homoserine lactone efflux protein